MSRITIGAVLVVLLGVTLTFNNMQRAEAVACNPCGTSATYTETISSAAIRGATYATRRISASGCPNHYCYCTGKGANIAGCGNLGAEGTATDSTVQNYDLTILATPVFATTPTDLTCTGGQIGIARNGVSIFSGWTSMPCNQMDVNSATCECNAFDMCSGHAQQNGQYHYHFPPSCLLSQLTALANGHSAQIGWALDGFPVYGPKGPFGTQMITCTQSNTQYCLDDCKGLAGALPGIDNFYYRYYFSGNTSDLVSLPSAPRPSNQYGPFSFKCYKGCTVAALTAGTCTSNGTLGAYGTPTALTGMVTLYNQTASNRKCYKTTGSNVFSGAVSVSAGGVHTTAWAVAFSVVMGVAAWLFKPRL